MKKYGIVTFLAMFMLAILFPMQANAESSDEFLLDETGTVTIRSQHAAKEELSSLQFSLSVNSAEAGKVEFEFGQNNARIAEFRYDENAKQLNIYMAGVEPLFAEGTDALTVGKIVVLDSNGNAAGAEVSVVEDSLQYVYGTELTQMQGVALPGTVQVGMSSQVPPQPEQPGQPEQPVETPPAVQETPAPDSGTDNDPNAGWNPGWQGSGDNSSGSSSNNASQGTGSGKKKPSTGSGTKVAGTGTLKPSTSPSPSVSPSPEPDVSEPVAEPEDNMDEANPSDEDTIISAMGSAEETGSEETGAAETKTNWLMIVVVIAIVIFVAVAVIAVVVLKGKQKPRSRRD